MASLVPSSEERAEEHLLSDKGNRERIGRRKNENDPVCLSVQCKSCSPQRISKLCLCQSYSKIARRCWFGRRSTSRMGTR